MSKKIIKVKVEIELAVYTDGPQPEDDAIKNALAIGLETYDLEPLVAWRDSDFYVERAEVIE